jgi:hypothetical protein
MRRDSQRHLFVSGRKIPKISRYRDLLQGLGQRTARRLQSRLQPSSGLDSFSSSGQRLAALAADNSANDEMPTDFYCQH